MKNRVIFPLLIGLLVSLLFSPSVFSEETVVRVAPHALNKDSDPRIVDIVIENGQNVAGYQVKLQFDSQFMKHADIAHGDYLPKAVFSGEPQIIDIDPNDPTNTLKAILFAATSIAGEGNGNGILATLKFNRVNSGASDLILLDETLLSNRAGEPLFPDLKDSRTHLNAVADLTVESVQARPKNTTAEERYHYNKGEEFDIHVTVRNIGNWESDSPKLQLYGPTSIPTAKGDSLGEPVNIKQLEPNRAVEISLPVDALEAAGVYYYTVCIEGYEGWNRAGKNLKDNNCYTLEIKVEELPDLAVEFVTANKNTLSPGETFTLTATLKNQGFGRADAPIYYRWHRSTHPNIHKMTGSERVLEASEEISPVYKAATTTQIPDETPIGVPIRLTPGTVITVDTTLGAGDSSNQRIEITVPQEPGTYYYHICVESPLPESNPNNNCSNPVEITVGRPDLTVKIVESQKNEPGEGDNYASVDGRKDWMWFELCVEITNRGNAVSPESALQYYHSFNENLSESDKKIEIDSNPNAYKVPALDPGQTVTRCLGISLHHFNSFGSQYFGAYVECVPNESNIYNNMSNPAEVFTYGGQILKISDNLISQVAFGSHYTYFVLRAHFPTLIPNQAHIGDCIIRLDLPGVPSDPDPKLANNPGYFMYPLETPEYRIAAALEEKREQNRGEVKVAVTALALTALSLSAPATAAAVTTTSGAFLYGLNVSLTALGATTSLLSVINPFTSEGGSISEEEKEILSSTADPILIFRPFIPKENVNLWDAFLEALPDSLYSPSHFTDKAVDVLFLVKSSEVNIGITITQEYKYNAQEERSHLAIYKGIWNLEETWQEENNTPAAPRANLMSLADYPPFQQLPPEVQAYLLQHFERTANTEVTNVAAWHIPEKTSLLPNYPNPFNPETWIPYQLATPADVTLTIYDINGHVVRDLDLGHQRAGMYQSRTRAAHWDGRNAQGEPVASGVYFYTLKAGDWTATRKMLIRK